MRSGQILQSLIGVHYQREPNTLKFSDKNMEIQYQIDYEKIIRVNQGCVICYLIICHTLAVLYNSMYAFSYQFLIWQISIICVLIMWIILNYFGNVRNSLKLQEFSILIYWFIASLYICYQQNINPLMLQSSVMIILYILIYYLIFQCLRNIYIKILVTFLISANIALINIQNSHFYSYSLITSGILMVFIIDFRNEIIKRYIYYKEIQIRKDNEELNNFIENCHNEQIIILKNEQIICNPLIFSGDFSDEHEYSVVFSEIDLKILHRNRISKQSYPYDQELLNYLSQIKLLNQDCVPHKLITQLHQEFQNNSQNQDNGDFQSHRIVNQFKKFVAFQDLNKSSRLKHPQIDRFQVRIANCEWQSQNAVVLIINPNCRNLAPQLSNSSLTSNSNTNSNQIFQSISHELKTPINAMYLMVQSCSTILKNSTSTKFEQRKELISILSDVQHNNQLLQFKVNDILDLKSFENNTFKIVRQEFLIRDTLDDIKELFYNQFQEKGISFSIQCHQNHQILYTDENRLKQLLINIVGNALKFTLAGSVVVLVEEVNLDYIQIQVIDTGIGIPTNVLNYLFALDLRHHEFKTSGVGLGLTISKLLVGELGPDAEIHVDSQPEVGTTISFLIFRKLFIHRESRQYYLPEEKIGKNKIQSIKIKHSDQLINTGSHKEIFYPTSSAHTQLPKQKILIVDDTSINIIALRCLIERLCKDKFEIFAAYNGLQAVEMVQKTIYDLIFMDVNMPLMDGIQATKIIREIEQLQKRHRCKIIVITAYSDQAIVKQSMDNGADICFVKPIQQKELQELLTIQKHEYNDSIVLI